MIGIDFISFIIILAISVGVTIVIHYLLKYYVIPGFWSFVSKVIIGWIGAWLGSPVLGYWFDGLNYKQVYIIPAILGAAALEILVVDIAKSLRQTEIKK